jgi:hypothetical protein
MGDRAMIIPNQPDTRGLSQADKFTIAMRDNFTCCFCGARPGNEGLEIDHLIPYSYCGSSNQSNLITACKKCNRGKHTKIVIPKSISAGVDDMGWDIHRTWGIWAIKFGEGAVYLTGAIITQDPFLSFGEYPIEIHRVHEKMWIEHIAQKPENYDFMNFRAALDYARDMTRITP